MNSCTTLSTHCSMDRPINDFPPQKTHVYRTTYAKVAGKYQDVLTLEQSVAELHQMFLDFALLTEQQGELLDQIEFQVKQAGDYVEEANVETHQAIEYQKSIRKKQWYVCIVYMPLVTVVCVCSRSSPYVFIAIPSLAPQLDHYHCRRCYWCCCVYRSE